MDVDRLSVTLRVEPLPWYNTLLWVYGANRGVLRRFPRNLFGFFSLLQLGCFWEIQRILAVTPLLQTYTCRSFISNFGMFYYTHLINKG